MVQAVAEEGTPIDESPWQVHADVAAQEAFARTVAAAQGYDFEAGRLDASAHPFSTGFGPGDVRITWRWDDHDLRPGLFGVMHEVGHALYEQGLPVELAGTPAGGAASLGVHESQSRLWENLVGRNRAFWVWAAPRLAAFVPATADTDPEQRWRALHTVVPSLIRVEADEATYNLHIAARFDVERALFAGELAVDDLRGAWDDAYERLLGIRPTGVADGVLQDIHWAMGAFGYFPTYSLGNLLASQLFEAMAADVDDLDGALASGDLSPILGWLRMHVHRHADTLEVGDLVERATGRPLSAEPLLAHLRADVEAVYGVTA
jgi:carboxypeptidase Taq